MDMLEQMDMMDLSDQDTVDVFLGCGTEESSVAGPLPGMCCPKPFAGHAGRPSCPQCPHWLVPQPWPPCVQIYMHPYKARHVVLGSVRLEGLDPELVHVSIHLHSPEVQTPVNTLCCRRQESPGTFQSPWGKSSCPEAPLEWPVSCHDFPGPHCAAELTVLSRKAAGPLHLPARPQRPGLGSCRESPEHQHLPPHPHTL